MLKDAENDSEICLDTTIEVDNETEHLFPDNYGLVKFYNIDGLPIYVTLRKGNRSRET